MYIKFAMAHIFSPVVNELIDSKLSWGKDLQDFKKILPIKLLALYLEHV